MGALISCGNIFFGRGDDDFPIWLLTIRVNILLLLVASAVIVAWLASNATWKSIVRARQDVAIAIALTCVAAAFRCILVKSNLFDHGGIPYSRMLVGYKGYFATAQFFSLFYQVTSRNIEHAILLDRVFSTMTVPLVYMLGRALVPNSSAFPVITALIVAVYPLHILYAGSDALSVFSVFLLTASYVLFVCAARLGDRRREATFLYIGAFLGLSLLTQVRYENVLFLLPPAIYVVVQRRTLYLRALAPGLAILLGFAAVYAYWGITSGPSYHNPVPLAERLAVAQRDILLNPFLSIPVLLVGTVASVIRLRRSLKLLPLLAWVVAFLLIVPAGDTGDHAARVYSNWLLLILAFSGYGFSVLLTEAGWLGKAVGGAGVLWLLAQPFLLRDCLTTQYLEVVENDYFRSLWRALPVDVHWVVVPDDDVMRRISHSTLETLTKYAMIRAGADVSAGAAQIVGITAFLERPDQSDCSSGDCVFFFGLPCMEQGVYPFTRDQCQELLRTHRGSVLDETTVVAAPFVDCSIFTGTLRQRLCDPVTKPQHFTVYRIEP